jgi:hypothetical protein
VSSIHFFRSALQFKKQCTQNNHLHHQRNGGDDAEHFKPKFHDRLKPPTVLSGKFVEFVPLKRRQKLWSKIL